MPDRKILYVGCEGLIPLWGKQPPPPAHRHRHWDITGRGIVMEMMSSETILGDPTTRGQSYFALTSGLIFSHNKHNTNLHFSVCKASQILCCCQAWRMPGIVSHCFILTHKCYVNGTSTFHPLGMWIGN